MSVMSGPICCLNCGAAVELEEFTRKAAQAAQKRILELEAQVKILSDKASAAGVFTPSFLVGRS